MPNLFSRFLTFTHSIRFRLVMWFAFILTLVLLAFSVFIYFNQLRDIRGESSYRMTRKLEDVVKKMQLVNGEILLPDGMLNTTDVLVILDDKQAVLASLGAVAPEQVTRIVFSTDGPQRPPDERMMIYFGETDDGAHYSFIKRDVADTRGQTYSFILGTPFDPYGLVGRLTLTLLAGSLLTLAVALGGGFWLADRAMRPVKAITATARDISETDLSRRINLSTRDELGELAHTFDGMLSRLEAAFARQRQFVADASHELRTPLTIVNLEAGRALSAKQRPAQEYQRALSVIQSENEFMTRLVNDLLILARMDDSRIPLDMMDVDLSDVALEAVERLESLAARHGVRLETGDLPEALLRANRQLLIQVASNLIENGIKYAGGAAPLVRVETGSGPDSAWLRVTDNGQGIPAEHLPHLFDRFYRADSARARADDNQPGGTGLGLSIVQSIVHAHRGKIDVESAPEQGTTFLITFPNSKTG